MEDTKGKLTDWIQEKKTVVFIRHSFSKFLRHFKDERGQDVYEERINEMCAANKQSLEVTYSHISNKTPTLAIWIAEAPAAILPILNSVAYELVLEVFPQYEHIFQEVYVRIRDLPIEDNLRDLRQAHLNQLIKIKGVVTKRTNIHPQQKKLYLHCEKCGEKKGPIYKNEGQELNLGSCFRCSSRGPFRIDQNETEY